MSISVTNSQKKNSAYSRTGYWSGANRGGLMTLGRRSAMAAAGVVGAFAFVASLTELRDWDTFHHLAYGREFFRRGGVPVVEPFLYPLAGQPAGPPLEWLSSVLIYLSWRMFGDAGPVLFAAALVAILAVALLEDGRDGDTTIEGFFLALAPVALMLVIYRGRAVARPEVIVNVLIAGAMAMLRLPVAASRAGGMLVGLCIVLWANLHPSVLFGIGLVVTFVVGNGVCLLLGLPVPDCRARIRSFASLRWLLAGIAAGVVISGLLTPVGFAPFHSALGFLSAALGLAPGSGHDVGALMKQAIRELQPMPLQMWIGPFGWLVAITVIAGLCAWRHANWRELLTCAGTIFLATRAQRFAAMAMVIMAPVAARHVRIALAQTTPRMQKLLGPPLVSVAAIGTIAAGWLMFSVPLLHFGVGVANHVPARAVDYLQAIQFQGRVFNSFHLGGYLEWRLDTKVYQDGRGAIPPGELAVAFAGPSSPQFEMLDRRYRFDALILTYPSFRNQIDSSRASSAPSEDAAADRGNWALVAFDDGGLLYLRRDGRYSAQAARDEYRFARPANIPMRLLGSPELPQATAEFERSLRESPGCAVCGLHLGFALLGQRRFVEANRVFKGALEGQPENRVLALMGLSRTEEELGDKIAAERHLRTVLAVAEDPRWPRRELARLLATSRRFAEALATIRKNAEAVSAEPIDLALGAQIARDAGDEALALRFKARLGGGGAPYLPRSR